MREITLPLDEETARSLRAGEAVRISGTVYTARDAAHKKMAECIEHGEPLPFELKNAAIYYVGPTPAKPGMPIGSAGPTTSSRMDVYTPRLLDLGLRIMIGKGRRSEAVKEAMVRNGAVYFVACGGAGALLSHAVVSREMIAWPELLSEAVTKLTVRDFPCFVGIDARGNDIYEMEDRI
jgi:fumarate hydratase subunit beta